MRQVKDEEGERSLPRSGKVSGERISEDVFVGARAGRVRRPHPRHQERASKETTPHQSSFFPPGGSGGHANQAKMNSITKSIPKANLPQSGIDEDIHEATKTETVSNPVSWNSALETASRLYGSNIGRSLAKRGPAVKIKNNIFISKNTFMAVLEVASKLTKGILGRSLPELCDRLYAELFPLPTAMADQNPAELVTDAEKEKFLAVFAGLFKRGAKIELPAALFQGAHEETLREYFKLVLEGFKRSGAAIHSPMIFIAGDKEGKIKQLLFTAEAFRRDPEMITLASRVIYLDLQGEVVVANRLAASQEPAAASFAAALSEEMPVSWRLPVFLSDAEEIGKLSMPERFRYWMHLTQLEFLAAAQLSKASSQAELLKQTGELLARLGVESHVKGGLIQPRTRDLLSSDLTEKLQAFALTSQAA